MLMIDVREPPERYDQTLMQPNGMELERSSFECWLRVLDSTCGWAANVLQGDCVYVIWKR